MSAKKEKYALMWYFLYKRSFRLCATEMSVCRDFIADILTIDRKGMAIEIEIKRNKSDFYSELRTIHAIMADHDSQDIFNKYKKHHIYLKKVKNETFRHTKGFLMPSKFYFGLPPNLIDYAKAALKGTPYGIICIMPPYESYVVKTASKLHSESVAEDVMLQVSRRINFENLSLIEKSFT
jgi:hypothetical protein